MQESMGSSRRSVHHDAKFVTDIQALVWQRIKFVEKERL
jgi:hypothetical protein